MNLKNKLAEFIEAVAEEAKKDPHPMGCHRYPIGNGYAVYIGWLNGYDKHNAYVIHAKDEPQWGLVAGVRKAHYTYWAEFDALDGGEEMEFDTTINPNMDKKDYKHLAEYLLGAVR